MFSPVVTVTFSQEKQVVARDPARPMCNRLTTFALSGQANKMVLVCQRFRLTAVIEAAMEIAGMQAAQKRLHVRAAGPRLL